MPRDRLSGTGAYVVARTSKELEALADEIDDPEVRDRILRVDTRRQSVIALPLFPDIESVGAIRSDQIVAGPGFQEQRTLRLDLGGARRRLMSVIAVDRLPRMPDRALVTEGGVPVVGSAVRGVRDKR